MSRKSVKYHGEREIKILKLLSKRMRDHSHVMKYLDVLLSFLDKSVKDSGMITIIALIGKTYNIMSLVCHCLTAFTDIRREALLAIQDIIPLLGIESTSKVINIISPLLVDAEIDVRLCICDLFESLAKIDFSLDDVVSFMSLREAESFPSLVFDFAIVTNNWLPT